MAPPLKKIIASRYGGRNIPIALVLPDGGRVPLSDAPEVDVYARTWQGLRTLASPELGSLARAYVHNDLDFTGGARRILGIAESLVGGISHGRERIAARARQWLHRRRDNKANIQHHYDVSNAFYRLWLDERMVYSCAYFRAETDSLDRAQVQKLDHICRKLRLAPDEEFLDIGCGWGALILHAAQAYGVRATGITLSQNQHDHVRSRISELGLEGRVRVELRDYLDLREDRQYDKIASIGMFEHVGPRNYPRYFGKIRRVLKAGGLVLNHGITHNWLGQASLGSGIGDFIEEYVFPGGALAHVSRVVQGLAAEGLELVDAEALREHYARTLWQWVDRLEAHADAARKEVGEERFRVWRIYLAGSAHAFDRGWLNIFQLLAGKPLSDGSLPHPATREYMYLP
ncbi:MAG TPA: cyclopropane-fatty-acyl-phospholipid synthase family protein [Casimicrobiaceae bacterium]|jgi:cyclopropane-fatty-acyl-phospholipid synthase|nr:cyclopropane-fatty-acyl-phospholipid synthase family protein [Casimicrobiaceae bacterium]